MAFRMGSSAFVLCVIRPARRTLGTKMRRFTMTLLTLVLSACTQDEGANDTEVQSATSASSTTASASASGSTLEPQTSSTLDVSPPRASSPALPSEPSNTAEPESSLQPSTPAPSSSSPPDTQPEASVEPQPSLSAQPEQSNDPETEPPGKEEDTESDPQEQSETEPEENDAGGSSTSPPAAMEGCEDGPLELPIEGCAPEFEETSDFYADCVARINQLRWQCQCLPPLERWTEAESCADQQAQYDYEVMEAHAGISAKICEPGGGSQNECPGYGGGFGIVDFCLQQMWDEGPGEDFQVHGHYINMSSETVTRVACGRFETADGEIWSVQNFSR